MSSYVPPLPTPARTRPGQVTAASYLLYSAAVLYVINAMITLAYVGRINDAIRTGDSDADSAAKSIADAGAVIGIVFALVIAAFLVVLGVFVSRGNNAMRITTWVIAGLGVLCTFCGAISGGLASSITSANDSANTARIEDAVPGWAHGISIVLDVLMMLALVAVIILLTLPVSNAYFRGPDPVLMGGYPAYPTYPAYPPVPGTPDMPGLRPATPPPPPASPWTMPGGAPSDDDPNRPV